MINSALRFSRELQMKRVPLDRIMVETDAPYLGFTGCRKGHSKPKKQVCVHEDCGECGNVS